MLYATGLTPEQMNKPQIGVSSVWWQGNPCNKHLLDLAGKVAEGVKAADMVSFQFNTAGALRPHLHGYARYVLLVAISRFDRG